MSRTITLADESQTDLLGERLAASLPPGLVVALIGDLGAGKTRLVRAVATALGADPDEVNSPTFVLVQRYEAKLPVIHIDAYRLRDANEFEELGTEDLFDPHGICLVEWADRVADALPVDHLRIELSATGLNERRATLTATGPRSSAVLNSLSHHMS